MPRNGFTLIEILTVLGIIAILSAIAIPRYTSVRERALVSTMMGDLHNLRLAQEMYHRAPDHDYASDVAQLGDSYATSDAVIVTITDAGADHYSATAEHPGTSRTCEYTSEENLIVCAETASGGKDGAGK